MEPAPKILYSRVEAAKMLSISVSSLDELIARGLLRAVRKGRRVALHVDDIERLAAKNLPRMWRQEWRNSRKHGHRHPSPDGQQRLTLEP